MVGRLKLLVGRFGLSPRSKMVIELAVYEARRLNCHYIGTEHLLLGLVREREGVAAEVLAGLGVSLETLRAQVIQVLVPPSADRSRDRDPATDPAAPSTEVDFERFTEDARRVLTLAQDESQRFKHHYVGTEHLLLGLTREPGQQAGRVLAELNVQLPLIRLTIESIIEGGKGMSADANDRAPRAMTALVLAVDEAYQLGDERIDTGHLLLGLTREGEGIAARILEGVGVDRDAVRARML